MSAHGDGAKTHYILDVRSCVGNCAVWWAPDGQGYVCGLGEAGLFTEKRANSGRATDVAVPRGVAESLAIRHVRIDVLREHMDLPYPDGRKRPRGVAS